MDFNSQISPEFIATAEDSGTLTHLNVAQMLRNALTLALLQTESTWIDALDLICSSSYDIKGCEVDRWTDPNVDSSDVIVVFKDCDFGDKVISLSKFLHATVHVI